MPNRGAWIRPSKKSKKSKKLASDRADETVEAGPSSSSRRNRRSHQEHSEVVPRRGIDDLDDVFRARMRELNVNELEDHLRGLQHARDEHGAWRQQAQLAYDMAIRQASGDRDITGILFRRHGLRLDSAMHHHDFVLAQIAFQHRIRYYHQCWLARRQYSQQDWDRIIRGYSAERAAWQERDRQHGLQRQQQQSGINELSRQLDICIQQADARRIHRGRGMPQRAQTFDLPHRPSYSRPETQGSYRRRSGSYSSARGYGPPQGSAPPRPESMSSAPPVTDGQGRRIIFLDEHGEQIPPSNTGEGRCEWSERSTVTSHSQAPPTIAGITVTTIAKSQPDFLDKQAHSRDAMLRQWIVTSADGKQDQNVRPPYLGHSRDYRWIKNPYKDNLLVQPRDSTTWYVFEDLDALPAPFLAFVKTKGEWLS